MAKQKEIKLVDDSAVFETDDIGKGEQPPDAIITLIENK